MKKRLYLFCIILTSWLSVWAQQLPMEQDYFRLAENFVERDKYLLQDIKTYLQLYPYSTYEDEVRYMQAVLWTERNMPKKAIKEFETIQPKSLSRPHQREYLFYRGYAYLQQHEYGRASIYFNQLQKLDHPLSRSGAYYYGYCQYQLGNYSKSLPAFERLLSDSAYQRTVPYYLVQIHYALHNYDDAVEQAESLLVAQPKNANNFELHRILGEMYFQQENYAEAVKQLQEYQKLFHQQAQENGEKSKKKGSEKREIIRNDIYILGIAQYKLGQLENAVNTLKRVKLLPDTLSESTCLTLGNIYVQLGNIDLAKLSFQTAMKYGYTPSVTEEAAYNYALTTYQSSSIVGDGVSAFRSFINNFPMSEHTQTVYSLLSDAFVKSRNYKSALDALDSINHPTVKMLQTKQFLRYQLGVDAFLQGNIRSTYDFMTQVINHTQECNLYTAEAYYWRAEASYRLHDYPACEKDLQTFFQQPKAKHSENYSIANYLNGYTQFSQAKYPKAREAFLHYVDESSVAEPTYADALNRIGDCYFNARNYPSAISYYTQVVNLNNTGSDYATYQRGYAYGLTHDYEAKINDMQSVYERFPKSDFADDGLYEMARAQLQLDRNQQAVNTYEVLLQKYPNSALARQASLERAMIYRNMHNYEQAIKAYKQTIDKYINTEEAFTALHELEAIYVETNHIDDYVSYTKRLEKKNMKVPTKEDSLSFTAAELQYMQANYQVATTAFSNYLQKYCSGGRYCMTALYYQADSYYRLGQMDNSLAAYRELAQISGNPYLIEACTRAAELSYRKGDFQTALEYFYKIQAQADTHQQTHIAQLGILRCNYYLHRYPATIDAASQMLNDNDLDAESRDEATFCRGKAYVDQGKYNQAIPDLQKLVSEVRTATGAEAKYLLAECYFHLGNLQAAEQEINSLIQSDTQQQYWLAKSIILLSDISLQQGDDFLAQQYLLSLQNNYTISDEIPGIIAEKLQHITIVEPEDDLEEEED